tara:strand:+ start:1776 stop:3221 length:1446 start_codon:yes stop_codon:yes gene_type:complete
MNNKVGKSLLITFLLLIFIFFLKSNVMDIFSKNSSISDTKIIEYISNKSEITLVSNFKYQTIKNIIRKIPLNKRKEFDIVKQSLLDYLGIKSNRKIKNIYDGEFSFSIFNNNNKRDILLIFKIKNNKIIKNIFDIDENNDLINKIVKLNKSGKLNYLSYITLTKDNYLITSSNKSLIYDSLNSSKENSKIYNLKYILKNNKNVDKKNILVISKDIYLDKINKKDNIDNFITSVDLIENKIFLESYTFNNFNDNKNFSYLNSLFHLNKSILLTNQIDRFKEYLTYLFESINEKDLYEEILDKIGDTEYILLNNKNWLLGFSNYKSNKIDINNLESLKNHNKEVLINNDKSYSVLTKDEIIMKDSKVTYEREDPLFIYEDNEYIFISNNIEELLNISNNQKALIDYLNEINNSNSERNLINDKIFINHINDEKLKNNFDLLNNLNYFTINKIKFSIDNIKVATKQKIPERNPQIYLKSELIIM